MITNFTVTLDDIKKFHTKCGPDVLSQKGKMVRRQPKPVVSNYVKIPEEILQLQKTVLVVPDSMFVNGMEFLVIISRHVKFPKL